MKNARSRYYGHRFPAEIISYAVWVYHRFCISFRDVMPAVFGLGSNRRQNACRFTSLDDADNIISFRLSEISIDVPLPT